MAQAERGLADHSRIERRGPMGSVRFSPEDALDRHADDRAYIERVLAAPCFVSDLSDVIEARRPALWIHGHTHDSFDYRAGATQIVCNPKGYGPRRPGHRLENLEFCMKVVEVG